MAALIPSPDEKDLRKIVTSLREVAAGRSNATGSVTLAANAGATTVRPLNCAPGSAVFLFPTTADAAAEFRNGTIWINAVAKQSFTITHANNAQADRTFFYLAIG
jgi:competence transcription factor ComK